MDETSAQRAREQFRRAFRDRTPDWPMWFVGIDLAPTKSADAVATFAKSNPGHIHIPVVIWHSKRAKAQYYKSLAPEAAKINRIGLVVLKDSTPNFIRRRFFECLANARKQYNHPRV